MSVAEFNAILHAHLWMEGEHCRRIVSGKATRGKFYAIVRANDSTGSKHR